ncbi:MAG TPA: amidase, partial [Candidatus Cloacimonadota bacterium]|nr:amidase [Candidatus Cloacimonadota bacterium]
MYVRYASLHDIAGKLRNGELDLISYINDACDWIDKTEPIIEALLPEQNRRKRLLLEAGLLLKKFPLPSTRPQLFGVLVGIKDLFNIDGFDTQAGSSLPPELFQGIESAVVTELKKQGALILGKTVSTEFAYFQPGPTSNPLNPNHTPGGSSSGSAAAVAAGFCPLAFGTQTIGSIIRPASYCGIAGFKPSFGRLSTSGVFPFSQSADHIGFMTQTLEDLTFASSVIIPGWKTLPHPEKAPIIGVP